MPDHLNGVTYWYRWVAGTETRAPNAFFAVPPGTPDALPTFNEAFDALMSLCANHAHTTERWLTDLWQGRPFPRISNDDAYVHAEAAQWWSAAVDHTRPGGSGSHHAWKAFAHANAAIEHHVRHGQMHWGEEPIQAEHDHWLFYRDDPTFWSCLVRSLEHEHRRGETYERIQWTAKHSMTLNRLRNSLAAGYAPWSLLAHRATRWGTPDSEPNHTGAHQRAETTLALEAWFWALQHPDQAPAPYSAGVSQALSSLTLKEGWQWLYAWREIQRWEQTDWSWHPNVQGHDPRLYWIEIDSASRAEMSPLSLQPSRWQQEAVAEAAQRWTREVLQQSTPESLPAASPRPRL